MKIATLPAVLVEPELLEELEAVLGVSETVQAFVVDAVRRAISMRQAQAQFYARGETTWQEYQRTGVSSPCDEVFDQVQARIDAKRRELAGRGDAEP